MILSHLALTAGLPVRKIIPELWGRRGRGLSSDEESILESDLDFDSDYSFMFSDNDE